MIKVKIQEIKNGRVRYERTINEYKDQSINIRNQDSI